MQFLSQEIDVYYPKNAAPGYVQQGDMHCYMYSLKEHPHYLPEP